LFSGGYQNHHGTHGVPWHVAVSVQFPPSHHMIFLYRCIQISLLSYNAVTELGLT
jgi:hypothetical protein